MSPTATASLAIDRHVPAAQSIVLRYASTLAGAGLTRADLAATSQREGARLLELPSYRGVQLYLLDESSCMRSGTYKSLDGCISTALCRRQGIGRAVFSSGANAGIALTDYAARTGLETFFFCPASTLYKLDARLFQRRGAHLVAVAGADRRVKEAARIFARLTATPLIPTLDWRMLSASCRGLFLAEQVQEVGPFDWFVQTVCAAYGPIGIYRALNGLVSGGQLDAASLPRFLGVQQAGLAPLVDAWSAQQSTLNAPAHWVEEAIEPTLYNMQPSETYPSLRDVLLSSEGDMMAVTAAEFRARVERAADLLRAVGVVPTRATVAGEATYLEKAGLLAVVATLQAIDQGRITRGQIAVCAFTGGAAPAPQEPARPELVIGADADLEVEVERYCRAVGA